MTTPVTLYRWDDAGAPQVVTGKPSEYIEVIKKCLVNGYGTKAGQGWSIADESLPEEPPYLALKNNVINGGAGGVVTFDAPLNDSPSRTVKVQSFLDFTSRSASSRAGAYFVFNGGNTSSPSKNWVLIGSPMGFYFMAANDIVLSSNSFGTHSHVCFFAGDISSFYSNDPASFVTLSGQLNSTSTTWNGQLNGALSYNFGSPVCYIYSLDGSSSRINGYIGSMFSNTVISDSSAEDSQPAIKVLCPQVILSGDNDLNQSQQWNSETLPFCRGYVPGLFVSQEYGYKSLPMFSTVDIDGQAYIGVPRPNSGGVNNWINTEQW